MAYTKGFPASKLLREKFQHVSFVSEVEAIARAHLEEISRSAEIPAAA
jgi:hypothetical protein